MQTRCHLSVLIHEQAKKYGSRPALTFRHFGSEKWSTVSWNQFSVRVKQVSNALLNMGLKPQEAIAVFAQNCIQYLYTDFGAYGVRVISIPFYATSSEQQIQYMIHDAGVKVLFVGEQEQYDKAHRIFPLCPTLLSVGASCSSNASQISGITMCWNISDGIFLPFSRSNRSDVDLYHSICFFVTQP